MYHLCLKNYSDDWIDSPGFIRASELISMILKNIVTDQLHENLYFFISWINSFLQYFRIFEKLCLWEWWTWTIIRTLKSWIAEEHAFIQIWRVSIQKFEVRYRLSVRISEPFKIQNNINIWEKLYKIFIQIFWEIILKNESTNRKFKEVLTNSFSCLKSSETSHVENFNEFFWNYQNIWLLLKLRRSDFQAFKLISKKANSIHQGKTLFKIRLQK